MSSNPLPVSPTFISFPCNHLSGSSLILLLWWKRAGRRKVVPNSGLWGVVVGWTCPNVQIRGDKRIVGSILMPPQGICGVSGLVRWQPDQLCSVLECRTDFPLLSLDVLSSLVRGRFIPLKHANIILTALSTWFL